MALSAAPHPRDLTGDQLDFIGPSCPSWRAARMVEGARGGKTVPCSMAFCGSCGPAPRAPTCRTAIRRADRSASEDPTTPNARRTPAASLPPAVEGRATPCLVPELSPARRALRAIPRGLLGMLRLAAASFCYGVYEMAS